MIYIAVVSKLWQRSQNREGSWASFIDKNKGAAIRQAIRARDKWEAAGHGPYQILVGTLTEDVVPPAPLAYRLVPVAGSNG